MSNLFAGAPLPGRFDRVQRADLSQATTTFRAMDIRDKEAARRFERAEDMRREDLDKVAGFDISGLGQMGSELFKVDADALAEQIKNGELDPTEARAAITKLTGDYRQYKAHGDAMKERSEYAKSVATDEKARQAHNDGLSVGYQTTYGVDDYGLQKNASMNQLFVPGSAKKGADGKWTVVDPNTNQRVPITQVTGYADPNHFYRFGEEKVDVGDLQTTAMSESVQNRILKRGNNVFYEENAIMEYDTLTENNNRSGQGLRLQILEDYQDESGNSTYFNDSDEQRAFQFGPNGYNRIQGIRDEDEKIRLQQAWLSVWGPPAQERKKDDSGNIVAEGSGWGLLNAERSKFVEYARTKTSTDELIKRERLRTSRASGTETEEDLYGFDETIEDIDVETGPQPETAMSYGMTTIKTPIQVEASSFGDGGDYEIHAFGVDPRNGNITARIFDDVTVTLHQYTDENGSTLFATSAEEATKLAAEKGGIYEGKTSKVKNPNPPQRTVTISPGNQNFGNEVYNRIFGVDPSTGKPTNATAIGLLNAHMQKANRMVAQDAGIPIPNQQ